LRLEQFVARAAEEFGVDTGTLVAEYGPDVPVPVPEEAEPATAKRRRGGSAAGQDGPGQARPGQNGAGGNGAGWNGAGGNGAGHNGAGRAGAGARRLALDAQVAGADLTELFGRGDGAAREGALTEGPEPAGAAGARQAVPEGAVATVRRTAGNGAAHDAAAPCGGAHGAADGQGRPDGPGRPDGRGRPDGPGRPDRPGTAEDGRAPDGAAGDNPAASPAAVRTVPYVRAEQEKRAAAAQRQLDQLGKVNPLALEEYAALEERHQFLATQLEDLKKTRRDLLTVVKEVDDRVQQVFTSAFADTAAEFEQIFSRLFPGGEGRLVLTEPGDMLATGIDVEARPPGKKVKRLSLLSGGERSLTAIAFLLAIFKARPSPFYVLDEVEAALDDTNLQRLLGIFEELRGISQLIVVTHQKRTMEVADALYGTSMQGDGVSTVVSQRLRERAPA
jgi:hypothetical protein